MWRITISLEKVPLASVISARTAEGLVTLLTTMATLRAQSDSRLHMSTSRRPKRTWSQSMAHWTRRAFMTGRSIALWRIRLPKVCKTLRNCASWSSKEQGSKSKSLTTISSSTFLSILKDEYLLYRLRKNALGKHWPLIKDTKDTEWIILNWLYG